MDNKRLRIKRMFTFAGRVAIACGILKSWTINKNLGRIIVCSIAFR